MSVAPGELHSQGFTPSAVPLASPWLAKSHHIPLVTINSFNAGTVFIVCGRQILTYMDDPRNERIKIFIMAIDQYYRYLKESERRH